MNTKYPTSALTILALLGAAAALNGCADAPATANQSPGAPCAIHGTDAPAAATVALLVGQGATLGQPQSLNPMPIILKGATAMKSRVLVSAVGDGPDAPSKLVDTHMVAEGPNQLFRDADLKCKADAVTAAVQNQEQAAAPDTHDIVSALRGLRGDLVATNARNVNVVLIGPVVTHTTLSGGQTLDNSTRQDLLNPAQSVNRLVAAGLGFKCDGWRVSMLHGDTGDAARDAELMAWWKTFFQRCGGTLAAWSSTTTQFPPDGSVENADQRVAQPEITFSPRRVVATLPNDVLFASGSAVLRPAAGRSLIKLRETFQMRRGPVLVTGHTDSTGTSSVNGPLSRARAREVAAWLSANLGVPRNAVRVRGAGSSDPIASNASVAGRAKNRRVVITFPRAS